MGKWLREPDGEITMWMDDSLVKVTANRYEPYFILRAQDRFSTILVRLWALMYKMVKGEDAKYSNAIYTLHEMELYQREIGSKFPD